MYDIIIIGGGIVGANIARRLSRYDLKIALLEKELEVSMGSSKANSAIVHGGYAENHNYLKGRLCYKGRCEFERLNRELGFGFSPIGSLVIAFSEEERLELEKLYENGLANGLDDLEIIDRHRIMELEPNINKEVKYALHCKGAGVCSPYEMVIALMENAVENDVEVLVGNRVTRIDKSKDGFIVTTNQGKYMGRYIINAAGLEAGEISRMVGDDSVEIKPRSGEYMVFQRGTGDLLNKVVFQMPIKMGKGILVTSTYHGNLLIGPDAIDEEVDDKDTHLDRLYKIYSQALRTTEKININQLIRTFAGTRSVSTTNDFIIGKSKVDGFINVAGIQSPGVTSSPAIAILVEEILGEDGLELKKKSSYNPIRKAIIEKKEMIEAKEVKKLVELPLGSPDRLVCRCEQVSEKTIMDALSRGIEVKTIDGIKRRTRAGMGFCQGGFCRERVIEEVEYHKGEIQRETDVEHQGIKRITKGEFIEYVTYCQCTPPL